MAGITLSELLKKMIEMGGSDLHITTNALRTDFCTVHVYHTHIFGSNTFVAIRPLLHCFIRRVPLCSVAQLPQTV